jgi:hypothetical protein
VFHHFHTAWLVQLSRALNEGVLPEGYIARTEEYVGPYQADVLTLETGGTPPATGLAAPRPAPGLRPTVTIAPPRLPTWRRRRIGVFSAKDERRVALLEVVSPGNKDSQPRADQFRDKLVECVASGLHVLLVDLLPPTRLAPGIGAAVARELGGADVPEEGRSTTSFEVQERPPTVRVYHATLALGATLPSAPLFLEPGRHVEVPLDPTYGEAVACLPRVDRAALGS